MLEGLYIASSAGVKQQRKLEVISNNMANVNTPGFKKDALVFKELVPPFMAPQSMEANRNSLLPTNLSNHGVSYVDVAGQTTDLRQGTLNNTGNPFDLAMQGDGFLVVETPDGPRYTRTGSFKVDDQRRLVDKDGNVLKGVGETNILLPLDNQVISVDKVGTISVRINQEVQNIGQLKVVQFENPKLLKKEGDSLYSMSDPDQLPIPVENPNIQQGFIENSNVSAVEEMTKMIQTVRTFEAYQKIIQSIDEADQQSVNSIARLA
ncbi:putative Flagellar basal-body rod protein flgG [Nitrospina gracilis 3/211]|uniref:Putative Flagellar basal-body rod protein flgG n=1 Tax=Nitrospina gracilis (strain 3/211) TaxID=1266370 RepID=M1YWL5_NITG3|nr:MULTISPECIES: flagellar basal-body rod protein FlgF [Nitrospina]MCF8722924.1 flagellar basal-body rod protein FlgG [Nitrospina sp. Nb-3]CCQ89889.1 putative Flagellar basal-body rod protein flgG [Nitrospina gracilis 3/211]